MKKILLFISFIGFDNFCFSQVEFGAWPHQNENNNSNSSGWFGDWSINDGYDFKYYNSINILPCDDPNYSPLTITENAQVTYEANSALHFQTGFHAGDFNNGGFNNEGYFHAKIKSPTIIPFIMQGATNHVGKFKLFETGFQMPPEIKTKIDNYLNNLPGEKLNPYNPDEINVSAIFNSSSNANQTRFGFYYQDFERNLAYSNSNGTGRFEPIETAQPWRIRFAPTELGAWTFKIFIYINGQYYTEIGGLSLWCDPSNEKGFLEVGTHNRQFRFSDTQTSFYALGQDIAWPDSYELLNVNNNLPNCQNLGLDEWINTFATLGNHHGNFARIVMKNLEPNKLNDYQNDQNYMKTLDEIITVCEQKDMYLDLCMLLHTGFNLNEPGWASENWNNNRYHIELGLPNPQSFFENWMAKSMYKKRLRYIQSRFGWSNHIGAYELVSELNNFGNYSESNNTREVAKNWHNEMAGELKNFLGAKQMLSTTFFGTPTDFSINNTNEEFSPYDLSIFNFTSSHSYQSMRNEFLILQNNYREMLDEKSGNHGWDKPTGITEIGLPGRVNCGGDVGDYECCNSLPFHNHVWATSFMEGFGCGLNWWAWAEETRMSNYDALHQFFSNVDFEQDSWTHNQHWVSGWNFADNDIPIRNRNEIAAFNHNYKIEVFAMTTNSSHKAMGWVHQATNWWGNNNPESTCPTRNKVGCPTPRFYNLVDDDNDDECCDAPGIYQEEFQVTGLVPFKQYQFDFYRTDDGAGAWYNSQFKTTNILGSIHPLYPCDALANIYDFAFKASKSGINFRSSNIKSEIETDTLPCGSNSFKISYILDDDSLGLNNYLWTWGNKISTEQFPNINFENPGIYNIKLVYKNPNGKEDSLQQKIFIKDCNSLMENVTNIKYENDSHQTKLNYTVYPNPSTNIINIESISNEKKIYTLYDLLGNVIRSFKDENVIYKIDISEFASGIYFLEIKENNIISNIKILKK